MCVTQRFKHSRKARDFQRTGTPLSSDRWKEVTLWDDWSSRANAELKQLKENNVLAGGYSAQLQRVRDMMDMMFPWVDPKA